MSSIVEGYNYDIFISYRQKDNKGDHWVSEFVEALKTELESTFKEEISVYFDINPHDGLLETHDVSESLKEKLKCLIFIPIISRTYCDPKSFAWENELKAFVEMGSKDQFGLKVKLANGNVASRILPIQIHEINTHDKSCIEKEITGNLRAIDFNYKEQGVNRPLTMRDAEDKNLNRTNYRNQINKAGNAIQEIISGLSKDPAEPISQSKEGVNIDDKTQVKDKSIIVLPFENISSDPEQEYFSDGLTEEIITDLSYIHDLFVISRSSAMTFKGSKKTIPEIAREVNVRYVLEGSVRKSGSNLKIVAQLIDAATDTHLWAKKYNGTLDDIFDIQEKVSYSISEALKLKLSGEEKARLSEVKISNAVSYEFYIQAKKYMWSFTEEGLDHALELTNQAISLSGDNALLYATRSLIFWQYQNTGVRPSPEVLEKADTDADKAIELDPSCSLGYKAKASVAYTSGKLEFAVVQYKKAADLETGGESLSWMGYIHALAGVMEIARDYGDKAARIDPLNDLVLSLRGIIEIYGGDLSTAISFLKRAAEINPDNPMPNYYLAIALKHAGNHVESSTLFKSFSENESHVIHLLGNLYSAALNQSEKEFLKYSTLLNEYAIHDKEISWIMADCFALTGHLEGALFWIENSINEGLINHIFFSEVNTTMINLRNDPRFIALMEKAKKKEQNFRKELGY